MKNWGIEIINKEGKKENILLKADSVIKNDENSIIVDNVIVRYDEYKTIKVLGCFIDFVNF